MLAVKFHHLRALTHRPFLCLPLLQMNNPSFMNLLRQDRHRISQAEWNCIYEARQTAHLLHNVVDERSLVHDFPWWQMISCLICARSILFVAETFHRHNDLLHGKTSAQDLRDDTETCLKVFEALSMNSAAAQKAAEILGGLSRMRRPAEEGKYNWLIQDLLIAYSYLPSAKRCQETSSLPHSPPYCPRRTHKTVPKPPPTPWDQPPLPHHHMYLPTFHFLANGPVKYQVLWNGLCDFSISRTSHQSISLSRKMGKLNNNTIIIWSIQAEKHEEGLQVYYHCRYRF